MHEWYSYIYVVSELLVEQADKDLNYTLFSEQGFLNLKKVLQEALGLQTCALESNATTDHLKFTLSKGLDAFCTVHRLVIYGEKSSSE